MKKTLSFIAAALMLSGLTACSQNKTEPVPDIPGVAEELPEREFLTLTEADFTKVDMNLNISDNPPPSELHTIDLDALDFGEKMSPCKAEDVRRDYFPHAFGPASQEQYDETRNKLCEAPYSGQVGSAIIDGDGTVWLTVNYDNICSYYSNSHCWSLFSYEPESGELREILSREGLDSDSMPNLLMIDGRLLTMDFEGFNECIITEIDKSTGAEREVLRDDYSGAVRTVSDTLLLYKHDWNGDYEWDTMICEADIDTGEVHEISQLGENSMIFMCGDSLGIYEKNGSTAKVSTDYYTFETDVKGIKKAWGTPDTISFIVDGYNDTYLYYYDIEKRECCIMNINGYGQLSFSAGAGMISCTYMRLYADSEADYTVYYIVPRLGTAFRLCKVGSLNYTADSGRVFFTETKNISFVFQENGLSLETYGSDKLYWFDIS